MRELFIDKRFSEPNRRLLEKILGVLSNYAQQGYDLSLRQLYYQLVAGDLLPADWADPITKSTNSEQSYKKIGTLVSDARLAGLIDWNMIKDRGRAMVKNPHWENPDQFMASVVPQFAVDKWANQKCYIETMVEKQALEGVLEPVCRELDIAFTANKGYSSSSALYEAGKRIEIQLEAGKAVHIVYLGDHDPSGIDMSRDVEERLKQFANDDMGGITLHRVALNMDQVQQLHPPENPAKTTDTRAADYISKFGESSWELDAIEPAALADLVRNAVHELRDEDLWNQAVAEEKAMRTELEQWKK